jgi:glycosyltransferase involved in cell wall biosynthesis
MPASRLPVAIVQDHVVQIGGAERVLLVMAEALPDAPIFTGFYWPEEAAPAFRDLDIRPTVLDRVPGLRQRHRAALPVLPLAFGRLEVDADVVFCGSSGWAAGVKTRGRKIVYFHSLARWLHERDAYLAGRPRRETAGLALVEPWLRRWDRRAVLSADRHFVYSASMGDAVRAIYGIEPEILPPPVAVDPNGEAVAPVNVEPGFALCPCRLMAYKNIDAVVDAWRRRPADRLLVAGSGPEADRLRRSAPPNVTILGRVEDAGMRWLYRNCRLVVSAAYEPFGLITLEANAFGRPVAVLRQGGFRDTVIAGVTGEFFDEPAPDQIDAAVDEVAALTVDSSRLAAHAAQWSEDAFIGRVRAIVAEEAART